MNQVLTFTGKNNKQRDKEEFHTSEHAIYKMEHLIYFK